jgi:hypothetical protein
VIDPATRRNLGSQADGFAGQLGAAAWLDGGAGAPAYTGSDVPAKDAR